MLSEFIKKIIRTCIEDYVNYQTKGKVLKQVYILVFNFLCEDYICKKYYKNERSIK
jgi:hypothetical protein